MKCLSQTTARKNITHRQSGFTIIELMIATAVFSVILLIVTVGIMYFTRSYYNGVYKSATQNVARDIVNAVSGAIRFGSGDVDFTNATGVPDAYFCTGGYVFFAKIGEQYIAGDATKAGFYMQPKPAGACSVPADKVGRKQLLGDRMRVTHIAITDHSNGLYAFDVGVAYGDGDLLEPNTGIGIDVRCKTEAGSEYCAVAKQSATVQQRLSK